MSKGSSLLNEEQRLAPELAVSEARQPTDDEKSYKNSVLLSEASLEPCAHGKGDTDHLSAGVVDRAD